jgi:hypothetical protein
MSVTRRRIGTLAAGLYLVGAAIVLVSFLMAPQDGLANIGIALYVFPISFAGVWLGGEFPFMPDALGYYGGHFAYFVPAVLLFAILIWRTIGGR